jgi:BRCT domain type II-containing protein
VGGPLKKYEVTTPSGVKTTMKLNEDDARRLGVLDAPEQETETQAPDQPAETETLSKARSTRNKARTASSNKGDG